MGCDKKIDINFVVAHSAEAKPIVDYYRLALNKDHNAFKIFESNSTRLIISGQGRINATVATAYLAAISRAYSDQPLWINVGVAGHAHAELGTLWRVQKVTDKRNEQIFYPVNVCKKSNVDSTALITLDRPSNKYQAYAMYDMEAIGFFHSAKRFSSMEFIQSFKVISDNENNPVERFDRKKVASLIKPVIADIDNYVSELAKILINNIEKKLQHIEIKDKYLTHSQDLIIKELIHSVSIHGHDPRELIKDCVNAAQIINTLQNTLNTVELKI